MARVQQPLRLLNQSPRIKMSEVLQAGISLARDLRTHPG